MKDANLARINALSQKSRTPEGLTVEEKAEQASLRKEYVSSVKASLQHQLDNARVLNEHGEQIPLKRK